MSTKAYRIFVTASCTPAVAHALFVESHFMVINVDSHVDISSYMVMGIFSYHSISFPNVVRTI